MKLLLTAAVILPLASPALALDGQIVIHDPSTIMLCNGKYYVWGTGGSALVSDDGWTWRSGTRASRGGMAPDLIHIGDRYYQYTAANVGGQPRAQITMISTKSLDPNSPDYNWEGGEIVCSTDGVEDCNGIDPGAFLDPTTGRLWLTYGSYFGFIRVIELDPKTGKRLNPDNPPWNIAINCEATTMIYRDGWYYLLGTHGSCCRGSDSGYNIRVGRAKSVFGPFLDNMGVDMIQGGGKLVIGSGGRVIGPGHFGLLDLGDGVQKFSMHWEADLDKPGNFGVLDIRPLLWKDGWPVAGENLKEGTYEIESVRTGTAVELAVEGVPVGGGRGRGGGRGAGGGGRGGFGGGRGGAGDTNAIPGRGAFAGFGEAGGPGGRGGFGGAGDTNAVAGRGARGGRGGGGGGMFGGGGGGVVPTQDVARVSTNWPAGNIDLRMGNYMCQVQQKWAITAVTNAAGYPGSPYFKVTIAGTDRALAATEDTELVALPAFTGGPEQLWRIEQLTDGTWRIMPKAVPNTKEPLALSAIGSSFATLAKFDPMSDKQRWQFKTP